MSGISFAGVPHNFNFTPQQQAPMQTAPVPPTPEPSKIIPGAPASGNPDPNTPPAPGVPAKGQSPLDKYAEFFNTTSDDSKTKATKAPTILDATAQDYTKVAEKLDFSGVLSDDRKNAIKAGGDGAVTALAEVLNDFGRQLYAQSVGSATSVTKKGIELSASDMQSKMNQALTLARAGDKIGATNAVLNNPMYAPLVAATQQRFLSVKPELTADELAELTIGYFNNMSAPQTNQQEQQQSNEDPYGLGAFFS